MKEIDEMSDEEIIKRFEEIEEKIINLYEHKFRLIDSILKNIINTPVKLYRENENGTWNRFTITDNKENLDEGFWKSIRVERYSTKLETLKNKPKELKEGK